MSIALKHRVESLYTSWFQSNGSTADASYCRSFWFSFRSYLFLNGSSTIQNKYHSVYYYVGLSGNKSGLSLYCCSWLCLSSSWCASINSNTNFFISYFNFFFFIFFFFFMPETRSHNNKQTKLLTVDYFRSFFFCVSLVPSFRAVSKLQ